MDEEDEFKRVGLLNYQTARVAQEVYNLFRLVSARLDFSKSPSVPEAMPLKEFLVQTDDRPTPPEKRIEDMTPEEVAEKKRRVSARSRAVWSAAKAAAALR